MDDGLKTGFPPLPLCDRRGREERQTRETKMKQKRIAYAIVATEGTHIGYFAASSLKRTDTAEDNLTLDPVKMRLYSTEFGAETFIRNYSYRKFVIQGVLQVKPVMVTVELV